MGDGAGILVGICGSAGKCVCVCSAGIGELGGSRNHCVFRGLHGGWEWRRSTSKFLCLYLVHVSHSESSGLFGTESRMILTTWRALSTVK